MNKKVAIHTTVNINPSGSSILYSTKGRLNISSWGVQVTTDEERVLYIPWSSIKYIEELIT